MKNDLNVMFIALYISLLFLWCCILLKQNKYLKKRFNISIKDYNEEHIEDIEDTNDISYEKILKINIANIIITVILCMLIIPMSSINVSYINVVLYIVFVEFVITFALNISNCIYYNFIKNINENK